MLIELNIKNFILIDSLNIRFAEGLNILTGETGAGKSILIDSLSFITGDKQARDIIRTGQDSAFVEGIFDNPSEKIKNTLIANGIECDNQVIISRELNSNGRSIARINGKAVTISFLRGIGKNLIDIHGQHEHQSLLSEETHIEILDSFCGDKFIKVYSEYLSCYEKYSDIRRQIEELTKEDKYKLREMDLLNFQINEISEADLKPEEEETLKDRRNVLLNSEKIYKALIEVYNLFNGNEDYRGVYDSIGSSLTYLQSISSYDNKLLELTKDTEELYYHAEDVVSRIRDYKDTVEYDDNELDNIESRLDTINTLKRKYGSTIENVLEYYEKIKQQLSSIQRSEEIIESLNVQLQDYRCKLKGYADSLSAMRKSTARSLQDQIEKELRFLGMKKACFIPEVISIDEMTSKGQDKVKFLMSANIGEDPKPLSKIASGGEMSRIMLAIKSVIADIDQVPTMIFDEIDTGISGRTAQAVAEKMYSISEKHQLLCVTHLPQIASMADRHFCIKKITKDNGTLTNVRKMSDNERIEELARLISGVSVTELTREHAKQMMLMANDKKSLIRRKEC